MAWWAIPMERFIGVLKGMVSLMSNIDMNLANRVVTLEHLNHLIPENRLTLPTSLPAYNAKYPLPPMDPRMQLPSGTLTPIMLKVLIFRDYKDRFPITYHNVVMFKKYHTAWKCFVGSEYSQRNLTGPRRDDSFIWWMKPASRSRPALRRFGQVVLFCHVYI